jgi:hypothetical protein
VVLRRDQKSGSYIVEDLGPGSVATSSRPEVAPAASAHTPPPPTPRLVESPPPTAPPAPAEAVEAGASAPRAPRRRRSRGRKPRGASVLAAGAYIDPSAAAHPSSDEGAEMDDHDHDDLEDGGPGSEEPGAGDDTLAGESSTDMAPSHAPDAGEREEAPRGDAQERAPFSLFSWIRRDAGPRPDAEPEAPPRPGGGKPDPLE